MTRRTFLTVASAALASQAFAQGESKKRPLKKAVNLGMVKAPGASTLEKFQMIKDAGFHVLSPGQDSPAAALQDAGSARAAAVRRRGAGTMIPPNA